ncbi:MAG: YchJ family metal-binding protein [Crocinitomicaceae bacterium]
MSLKNGLVSDINGFVEFKAFYEEDSKIQFIHGHSRFIKENNHWVYLDEL